MVQIVYKIFTKPHRIKYSNISYLAVILGSLNRYHQEFVISVIDELVESIILGLELNDFKFNQRRIAEVKYMGELYLYRMVDHPAIFDVLYKILTFGHDGAVPKAGSINQLDLPDDYFRARLVCNILETCGVYYDKGVTKKKLDYFLTFFQYYLQTKDPLPMDIEFLVQDTFALIRPQWKLLTDPEEAYNAFVEAIKQQTPSAGRGGEAEDAEESSGASDDDELGDVDGDDADGDDDNESLESAEVCVALQEFVLL